MGIEIRRLDACSRLNRWWRSIVRNGMTTKQVMRRFFESGITRSVAVESLSFDDLVSLLREEEQMRLMSNTVQRVFYLSVGRKGARRVASSNLNIRVFLAAYWICADAGKLFENPSGDLEKHLKALSLKLLLSFEAICEELRHKSIQNVKRGLCDLFPPIFREYVESFKAWKIPDEKKVCDRIKHALLALYSAVDDCGDPDLLVLRSSWTEQIRRLRTRLLQVGGIDELRSFDARHGRVHLPVPSSCTGDTPRSTLYDKLGNRQLAHELLLDPSFKYHDDGGNDAEAAVLRKIRDNFSTAYWDSLYLEVKLSPPCYVRVLRVLVEARDAFVSLLRAGGQARVHKFLDVEGIKAHLDNGGGVDSDDCLKILRGFVQLLTEIHGGARNTEMRDLWEGVEAGFKSRDVCVGVAFCKGLKFVLYQLQLARIDIANAYLRFIAPEINRCGVEYERAGFALLKEKGEFQTELTFQWVKQAVEEVVRSGRVDPAGLLQGVYVEGVLGLIFRSDKPPFPEIFILDVQRLKRFQAEFRFHVFAATVLSQLMGNVQTVKCVSEFFKTHTLHDPAELSVVLEWMAATGATEEQCKLVADVFNKSRLEVNPVRKVFDGSTGRVASWWRELLSTHTRPKNDNVPVLFDDLLSRVQKTVAEVHRVQQLNLLVHADTVNKLIVQVVKH